MNVPPFGLFRRGCRGRVLLDLGVVGPQPRDTRSGGTAALHLTERRDGVGILALRHQRLAQDHGRFTGVGHAALADGELGCSFRFRIYFEEVASGYTTTGRQGLQAFTVVPLVVYRVFADGRPDELIRGVDIVGTPLASFQRIIATSNQAEVFNGYCGAESGSVPVSAVSPAILVSEIETQKKRNSQQKLPLLPRPGAKPYHAVFE